MDRNQLVKDLEVLNQNVGTSNLDNAMRVFLSKYPRIHLDFAMYQNKFIVVNNKGARVV